jgi:hypothetical protein
MPANALERIGKDVGHGRKGGTQQHAASYALQGTRQHQLRHAVGNTTIGGGQHEERD